MLRNVIVLVGFLVPALWAQPSSDDLNIILMESTVRIHGPSRTKPGSVNAGTCFILGRPIPSSTTGKHRYTLITAAHVLEDIAGDQAQLLLRKKIGEGKYSTGEWPIQIRKGTDNLYLRHKDADVAVIYVVLPVEVKIPLLPISFLVDDNEITRLEINPGDQLFALGFPFARTNEGGFPILRSGVIASYPIVPTRIVKKIGFDFTVFSGNSGGPVYYSFSHRTYNRTAHIGERAQGIIGLVSEQTEDPSSHTMLSMALVVPATFIKEVIEQLPAPKE